MFGKICLFLIAFTFCFVVSDVCGQGDGQSQAGGKKPEDKKKSPPNNAPKPTNPPKKTNPPETKSNPPKKSNPPEIKSNPSGKAPRQARKNDPPANNPPPNNSAVNRCVESELLIRCNSSECSVSVDGRSEGITDLSGELRVSVAGGKRKLIISKNGYESASLVASAGCGELETVSVKLKPKPFNLRLKTNLPQCDILINDSPAVIGKSDEKGNFSFRVETGTVYVQARKAGYLTDSLTVSPEEAQNEIRLNLKPIPAKIILLSNVKKAVAYTAEKSEKKYETSEQITLEAGPQKLIVTALGYVSQILELDLKPNEKLEKQINLERLPISQLLRQAEQSFKPNSFTETLELCDLVFETEPENPTAHRLVGAVYLEKQNYAEAEARFSKAVRGNEIITFNICRYYNEKFEFTDKSVSCQGLLLVGKNEIEFRGSSVAAQNFKVSGGQIQLLGLQIKKNAFTCLSLKVADAKGNKKEYSFFGVDADKNKNVKPYLELIQRIIGLSKSLTK